MPIADSALASERALADFGLQKSYGRRRVVDGEAVAASGRAASTPLIASQGTCGWQNRRPPEPRLASSIMTAPVRLAVMGAGSMGGVPAKVVELVGGSK